MTVARQKQPGRYNAGTAVTTAETRTLSVGGVDFSVPATEVQRRKNTLPLSKTTGVERPTFVRDLLRANETAPKHLNDLELARLLKSEFEHSDQTIRIVMSAGGEVGTELDKWAKWLRVQRSVYNRKQLRNEDDLANTWSFQYVDQSPIIPYTQTRKFPIHQSDLKGKPGSFKAIEWLVKNWREDPRVPKSD